MLPKRSVAGVASLAGSGGSAGRGLGAGMVRRTSGHSPANRMHNLSQVRFTTSNTYTLATP